MHGWRGAGGDTAIGHYVHLQPWVGIVQQTHYHVLIYDFDAGAMDCVLLLWSGLTWWVSGPVGSMCAWHVLPHHLCSWAFNLVIVCKSDSHIQHVNSPHVCQVKLLSMLWGAHRPIPQNWACE